MYINAKNQLEKKNHMARFFFSPAIYSPRAAAALDALADRISLDGKVSMADGYRYYTMTSPSGTMLEANLLLSCSDMRFSPVFRLLEYGVIDHAEPVVEPFIQENSREEFNALILRYETCIRKKERHSIGREIRLHLSHSVLEFRRSIRDVFFHSHAVGLPLSNATTTPIIGGGTAGSVIVFSDTLFGPYIAKVLNGLLILEACLANATTATIARSRHYGLPAHYREMMESIDSQQSSCQTTMISALLLQPRTGTSFAGDLLLLQYSMSWSMGAVVLNFPEESRLLMEALFPAFQGGDNAWEKHGWDLLLPELEKPLNAVNKSNFDSLLNKALREARTEMRFVINTIHGQALTILMAGNRRLGENSAFGTLDNELLCMIAKTLIWGS